MPRPGHMVSSISRRVMWGIMVYFIQFTGNFSHKVTHTDIVQKSSVSFNVLET